MRAGVICTLCVALANPTYAAAGPKNADEAAMMHREALGDRWPERWQGRQHYLYDDEFQPQTTGAGNARACANEPVRIRRPDGTTTVKRTDRCR
jgi:hypothetical protein